MPKINMTLKKPHQPVRKNRHLKRVLGTTPLIFSVLFGETIGVASTASAAPLSVASAWTIEDIRLEGLQRVEPGTVFAYLPVKPGDRIDPAQTSQIVRDLYATGFFSDVRLLRNGKTLVVQVQERPVIFSVDFSGIRIFGKEKLMPALRAVGLAQGHYYDKSLVDKAEQELKRQYLSRGYYSAHIKTTVTPIDRNRVALLFAVEEGSRARIRQIDFIGNKKVSTGKLADEMQISTPNWFSWYTRNDLYSKEKLTGDLENIRSYYMNRGYLAFTLDSTQVAISPDKKNMYLTIGMHEGEVYTLSQIDWSGNTLGKLEEFKALVKIQPGQRFSASDLRASTNAIANKLGEYGYAFASITAQPKLDEQNRTVSLTMHIEPGRRVYVRKIDIVGNTRTRDAVIRREMRQFESTWFDSRLLKRSEERVNHLGYFSAVVVSTTPVPGVDDQVDIQVKVTEKPTGTMQVGAGISSTDRVVLSAGISQENVFGSGSSLAFQVNTAKAYRTFSLSHVNPYFTMDGIQRITNMYYRTSQPLFQRSNDFTIVSTGGDIKFGIPFSEEDVVFVGVGIEQNRFKNDDGPIPKMYKDYIGEFGHMVRNVPLTMGWSRDGRDSVLIPSRGGYTYLNAELGTPAGNTKYYKLDATQQYYLSFSRGFMLGLNGQVGYGRGLNGKSFPIFKNYFAGGINSIRGYQPGSVGPRDNTQPTTPPVGPQPPAGGGLAEPFQGGAKMLIANLELTFPLPGTGYDRTLRFFTFIDAGNVWSQDQRIQLADLRSSYGVGITWISPVGPLKFSLGLPLVKKTGDLYQRFQFQMGTSF
jgi:outer membrane protein insertion porin family